MSPQITVYLVGATGRTGSSIADALLDKPDQFVSLYASSKCPELMVLQKLVAAIRSSSAFKPAVASLRERGADIHIIDLVSINHEQLVSELRNAHTNVLISAIIPANPTDIQLQKTLAMAAKEAGVKRFIPSDWASTCPPGVMLLQDTVSHFISFGAFSAIDVATS